MKTRTASSTPPVSVGDVVIALIFLIIFTIAYVQSQEWPFRARFFPQLLSIAGMVFAALRLIGYGVQAGRRRNWMLQRAEGGDADNEPEGLGAEEQSDPSIEYAFGTAGRRAWVAALGWAASFFVLVWLVGIFVTVPVFALVYLRVAGKTGWLAAVIYAGAAGGLLWLVFHQLLYVPMPPGIF